VSRAAVILLIAASAWARPVHVVTEADLPLRVVARIGGVRLANCIFSTSEIPPHARANTKLVSMFSFGDPMFARCYLPDHIGANKPGELVDRFFLDGKPWWTQAYSRPVPPDAFERPIALGEILRTILPSVKPGLHKIELWGTLKRGDRTVKLYHAELRYVR
jgi:hypothetical protein